MIKTYWPIDSYQYLINLSFQSLLNINTFIISAATIVVKYSKLTKKFLWQLAFNNKFYVFVTDRYKFKPENPNRENVARFGTVSNIIVDVLTWQKFKVTGNIIKRLLQHLYNEGIREYCKSGMQKLPGYDFKEGFKDRFGSVESIYNIVSNSYDLNCFHNLIMDYYFRIKRTINIIPKVLNNVASGHGMKKVQAKKDFKKKNMNIKTAPIDTVVKEFKKKMVKHKKINPITGGRYKNGYKPCDGTIFTGNQQDVIEKMPGYVKRQGYVAAVGYGICCIPVIGTPLVALSLASVCAQESRRTGSIFQGIKNTCVNLIYER